MFVSKSDPRSLFSLERECRSGVNPGPISMSMIPRLYPSGRLGFFSDARLDSSVSAPLVEADDEKRVKSLNKGGMGTLTIEESLIVLPLERARSKCGFEALAEDWTVVVVGIDALAGWMSDGNCSSDDSAMDNDVLPIDDVGIPGRDIVSLVILEVESEGTGVGAGVGADVLDVIETIEAAEEIGSLTSNSLSVGTMTIGSVGISEASSMSVSSGMGANVESNVPDTRMDGVSTI